MYKSSITAKSLIDRLYAEADFSPVIPVSAYIDWLNALESRLYSEIIKEIRAVEANVTVSGTEAYTAMSSIDPGSTEDYPVAVPRVQDIVSVMADDVVFERSGGRIVHEIPGNKFYERGGDVVITAATVAMPQKVTVLFTVRPEPKTEENYGTQYIMLPDEFIPMVEAYIRGQLYKVANEDDLAAKWVSEYNTDLQNYIYFNANLRKEGI